MDWTWGGWGQPAGVSPGKSNQPVGYIGRGASCLSLSRHHGTTGGVTGQRTKVRACCEEQQENNNGKLCGDSLLGGLGRCHDNSQMMMVSQTWRVVAHVLKHHFLAADGMAIFITTLLFPSSGSYRSPVIFKGRHADQTSGRRSPITTDPNAFISSLLSISSALPTQQIKKEPTM